MFAKTENLRRRSHFQKKSASVQTTQFQKISAKQNLIKTLPTSEEENQFGIVGVDSKNLLIGGSNALLIFSLETHKIVNSIRLNGPVGEFKLMNRGQAEESVLFRVEQNQLELVEIQSSTFQSRRNYVFTSLIRHAVPHPSGDFVIILDDKANLGVFDLMNVGFLCTARVL